MVYAWGKTRISSTMRITKQFGVAEHTKPIMKRGPSRCLVELPDVELRVRSCLQNWTPQILINQKSWEHLTFYWWSKRDLYFMV